MPDEGYILIFPHDLVKLQEVADHNGLSVEEVLHILITYFYNERYLKNE